MSLKPEQYIALSAAAYGDYSDDDKNQKIDRIRNKMQNNKLEYAALSSFSSYTLLDYISTPLRIPCCCPPVSIRWDSKGTDFDLSSIKGHIEADNDISNTYAQITLGMSLNLPAQFADAEKFVADISCA